MPHRCTDSWAWWRIVMSAVGPPSTTRSVLSAHFKFMNGDGTRCYPTVRRLAVDARLNKDTVAFHRKYAIDEGWLIVSVPTRSEFREFYPALPDELVAKYPELLSNQAGRLLSELARQAMRKTSGQSSEVTGTRVRSASSIGLSSSDKPPISLLTSEDLRVDMRFQVKKIKERSPAEMHERLRSWLESNQNVQKYQHDPDALARLTPLNCRLPGYENVIHQWCANRCKRS